MYQTLFQRPFPSLQTSASSLSLSLSLSLSDGISLPSLRKTSMVWRTRFHAKRLELSLQLTPLFRTTAAEEPRLVEGLLFSRSEGSTFWFSNRVMGTGVIRSPSFLKRTLHRTISNPTLPFLR